MKTGDKVTVKSLEWYNANKNALGRVDNNGKGFYFMPEHAKYCGTTATVIDVYAGSYKISADNGKMWWEEWMLEK